MIKWLFTRQWRLIEVRGYWMYHIQYTYPWLPVWCCVKGADSLNRAIELYEFYKFSPIVIRESTNEIH